MKTQSNRIRDDFPILQTKVHGQQLVYLDNAATTQKPKVVLDRIQEFYKKESSNVHRGSHFLSAQSTRHFEDARESVRHFINASSSNEIIFTRGTTESINLVAHSLAGTLNPGDEILLTELEHHSNIVPWQIVAEQRGAKIVAAPIDIDTGELDFKAFQKLLTDKVKVVSITACSNTLGTILPVEKIVKAAHGIGALVMVDAAQIVSVASVDVKKWDCDFLAFSGHKIFAPFGIGVLYGKEAILNSLPPYQGGGSMIREVSFNKTTFLTSPQRFEAGTPNVEGAIALAEALRYFESLDIQWVQSHSSALRSEAIEKLGAISGVRIFPGGSVSSGILSFVLDGVHASDIASILDEQAVAVRAGHHCTQPLLKRLGVTASVRVSFSIYNSEGDVAALVKALRRAKEILK